MPWITGTDLQIPEPCRSQGRSHVEAEVLLDIEIGAFEQCGDHRGKALKNGRGGILINHQQSTAWPQQPSSLHQHGVGRLLRQLIADELETDQIKRRTLQNRVIRGYMQPASQPAHTASVRDTTRSLPLNSQDPRSDQWIPSGQVPQRGGSHPSGGPGPQTVRNTLLAKCAGPWHRSPAPLRQQPPSRDCLVHRHGNGPRSNQAA